MYAELIMYKADINTTFKTEINKTYQIKHNFILLLSLSLSLSL